MSNLANTKSSLAKLLAGENITVQHKKVRTAGFDVKNRVLILPIYKKDISPEVYDTFVAHEVGHALYSPNREDLFKDKKLFRYVNLVEDIRIERMIKAKFPGLVKSFYSGYQQLQNDNFFGVSPEEIKDLCFGDRLNLNAKIGSDGHFNEVEEKLAEKARKVITFDDVMDIAREIMAYDDEQKEEEEEQKGYDEEGQEGDEEQEGGSGAGEGNNDSESEGEDQDGKSEGENDNEGGNHKPSKNGKSSDNKNQTSKPSKEDSNESNEDGGKAKNERKEMITDEAAEDNYGDFLDDKAIEAGYYDMANIQIEKNIKNFDGILKDMDTIFSARLYSSYNDMKEFDAFKRSNQKIVNYLHKEFEMKKNAEQSKRALESRSGTLDVTKMYRYKYDDNIFKKVTNVPNGKSHGLVMLLDWSGSMNDKLRATVKQVLSLVMFCKRAGIAFEVYAFSDRFDTNCNDNAKNLKESEIILSPGLMFLNFLSSKMTATKLNAAMMNLWKIAHLVVDGRGYGGNNNVDKLAGSYNLGGTPLNGSLLAAPMLVEKFRADHKSQIVHLIVLTDGAASDHVHIAHFDNYHETFFPSNIRGQQSMIRHGHKYYPLAKTDRADGQLINRATRSTRALLDYVKDVANVNIIGFFLAPSKAQAGAMLSSVAERMMTGEELTKFTKDGNLAISGHGYDEAYFIKSDSKSFDLNSVEEEYEFVDEKTALKDVKNQFKEIGDSIKKQRVFLNRFIATISNPGLMF